MHLKRIMPNERNQTHTQQQQKKLNIIWWASNVALVVKNPPANAGDIRDVGSIPESGRFPWRRAWQAISVCLPGESHGQRSLVGYTVHRDANS